MKFEEQLNYNLSRYGYAKTHLGIPQTIEELEGFISMYYFPKDNFLSKQRVKEAIELRYKQDGNALTRDFFIKELELEE